MTAQLEAPGSGPSGIAAWVRPRRAILMTIVLGMLTWPIAVGGAWARWPAVEAPADRLDCALRLAVAPALVLLVMIVSCMRLFDTAGAENPFANVESQRFKINQRVIANTVEQSAIFVPLLLALATILPDGDLKLLPIAVSPSPSGARGVSCSAAATTSRRTGGHRASIGRC